jgi:hypothetical protein
MVIRQYNTGYKTFNNIGFIYITGVYLCKRIGKTGLYYWHTDDKYKSDCAYGSRNNILQTLNLPLPYLRNFVEGT